MRGELYILDSSGHRTIEWDSEATKGALDPTYAEAEFNRLVAGGHLGYGTTETGEHEQLKRFDSTFPRVTVTPRLAGG